MSTRSMIGVMEKDGSIKAIYCHFDGYLDGVGYTLLNNYDEAKTRELIERGDISSLGPNIKDSPAYPDTHYREFKDDPDYLDYCWLTNKWVQYVYLLCDGEWLVSHEDNECRILNFYPVKRALQNCITSDETL